MTGSIRFVAPVVALLGSSALPAQSLWDSSVRLAPQFHAYDIKDSVKQKISEFSVPFHFILPITPAFTLDVGTAFATVEWSDGSASSSMSGLTDTQIRANYAFGQDFVVITAGVNLPTGSATVDSTQLEAATRIGSDFLMFPISGFGSGLGFTGGVAIARPAGAWNLGFGASVRQSTEYEPFRDPTTGTPVKYQPGPEYRARIGADRPFGVGRASFGLTYSKFGDDKSNAATFNSGNRFVGQFALNDALTNSVDYSVVLWHLLRTNGTLIDGSPTQRGNITNALLALGIRGSGSVSIEPTLEARTWSQQGTDASYLGTLGTRFVINRGGWAVYPGLGYSIGSMEGVSLSGYRGSIAFRFGGS